MAQKTLIVVSGMIDATIKEYQPDVDFKIFNNLDGLGEYLDRNPIIADILFVTQDVVKAAPSTSFSFLKDLTEYNDYLQVNRVVYITEPEAQELSAFNYLKTEFELDNWESIEGTVTRPFVQGVINGTHRSDTQSVQRKVVVRRPRSDYVADRMRSFESMEEQYPDDDTDLMDIPDEPLPEIELEPVDRSIKKVYISGLKSNARTAFSVIAAQYLSLSSKVLIIECDPDYHTLTEFITKSGVECTQVTMTHLYENPRECLDILRDTRNKLSVVTCIDRIPFNYNYITLLLYYNLLNDFDYMIIEADIDEVPHASEFTCVVESTIISLLKTGEQLDKSMVKYAKFVGIDLGDLAETHVSSGAVMQNMLQDILSEEEVVCPVVRLSSLKLGNTAYDLAAVLGGV